MVERRIGSCAVVGVTTDEDGLADSIAVAMLEDLAGAVQIDAVALLLQQSRKLGDCAQMDHGVGAPVRKTSSAGRLRRST